MPDYYPEQRYYSKLTVIRRDVMLPDEAAGVIDTFKDKRVDIRDVVARGVTPGHHIILDALAYFGLRKVESLEPLLRVEEGDIIDEVTLLVGKYPNRGKRLYSPVPGRVAQIAEGRIIIEQLSDVVTMEAGLKGRVTRVIGDRGVTIEGAGALLQGVWGNGRRVIASLHMEPREGLESLSADEFDVKYPGSVVVMRQPITPRTLRVAAEVGLAGIVAPSMDAALRPRAWDAEHPIMLTEGFGSMGLSRSAQALLAEFDGAQVTLDADQGQRWENRRPELIANLTQRGSQNPPRPNIMLTLRTGQMVRITRQPHIGETGKVVNLPKSPVLLDNGLRVPCAQVELTAGETLYVPLANLEVLGR